MRGKETGKEKEGVGVERGTGGSTYGAGLPNYPGPV